VGDKQARRQAHSLHEPPGEREKQQSESECGDQKPTLHSHTTPERAEVFPHSSDRRDRWCLLGSRVCQRRCRRRWRIRDVHVGGTDVRLQSVQRGDGLVAVLHPRRAFGHGVRGWRYLCGEQRPLRRRAAGRATQRDRVWPGVGQRHPPERTPGVRGHIERVSRVRRAVPALRQLDGNGALQPSRRCDLCGKLCSRPTRRSHAANPLRPASCRTPPDCDGAGLERDADASHLPVAALHEDRLRPDQGRDPTHAEAHPAHSGSHCAHRCDCDVPGPEGRERVEEGCDPPVTSRGRSFGLKQRQRVPVGIFEPG
jgi:hypothetical protein